MNKTRLGATDLYVDEIIMGTLRIDDKMSDEDAERYVKTALDLGYTTWDCADTYGVIAKNGRADERFSKAAELHKAGVREKIIFQTKVGGMFWNLKENSRYSVRDISKNDDWLFSSHDVSKENLLNSVDATLKRMNMEYIDVLQLHRPDPLMDPEEVAEAFDILHKSGKVRYFGVSNFHPTRIELLKRYLTVPIVSNQIHVSIVDAGAIEYSSRMAGYAKTDLVTDPGAGVLDYCRLNDITVQSWSPLCYLAHGWTKAHAHCYKPFVDDYEFYGALNRILDEIAEAHGATKLGIMMAWLLSHPAKIIPVVGTTNIERMKALLNGYDIKLTREEWYRIFKAGGNKAD